MADITEEVLSDLFDQGFCSGRVSALEDFLETFRRARVAFSDEIDPDEMEAFIGVTLDRERNSLSKVLPDGVMEPVTQ